MAGERTLIFGGSFDPPHWGHMGLLEAAVAAVGPGRVLVIPARTAPHKQASATPWALRAAMCECFRPLFPTLVVSDIEEERQGKSYTYDTLCQLRAACPQDEYYLCIGGDMVRSFTEWYRYEDILRMATLVVMGRQPGEEAAVCEAAGALCAQGGRVLFAGGEVRPLSSTDIRGEIAAGDDGAYSLMPPPADEIARREGLYRAD